MKKHIYDENNRLHDTLAGGYYLPDLKLLEENLPIGHYGRLHREYLKQEHPSLESRKYRENLSIWLYNIITAKQEGEYYL